MRPFPRVLVWLAAALLISLFAGSGFAEFDPEDKPEKTRMAGNPLFKLATDYLSTGEYEKAQSLLEKLLTEKPDDPHAKTMLAMALINQGAFVEGKTIFETLIEEHPDNHIMLNNYAWLLATSEHRGFRDPKLSLELAQEAILIAPNSYAVWSTLGEAHFMNGNFEKAVEIMEHCYDLAMKSEASAETLETYKSQHRKMSRANKVMRLFE